MRQQSRSTLFVKVKKVFRQKNTIFFKNYNLTPLDIFIFTLKILFHALIEVHLSVWMPKMPIFQAYFPKIKPRIKAHPWILKTSSPIGDDCSHGSQHNTWRYDNLWCSKAGSYKLETVNRNFSKTLCQSWLSASIKKMWIKWWKYIFRCSRTANTVLLDVSLTVKAAPQLMRN